MMNRHRYIKPCSRNWREAAVILLLFMMCNLYAGLYLVLHPGSIALCVSVDKPYFLH